MYQVDPSKELFGVSEELKHLANVFWQTGNDRISTQLSEISEIIRESTKALNDEHKEYINERREQAQHQMGSIISACLDNVGKSIQVDSKENFTRVK